MTRVMGILNVTPDSFADGGRYLTPDAAVVRAEQMAADGAEIIDVGGESTRPGAEPVTEQEELRRVLPVVEALAGRFTVSVDTSKAGVARAAVRAGAQIINDVRATLAPVAAELGVGWVAMHMRGLPRDMQRDVRYDDVVVEVRDFLVARADRARAMGVPQVWIDPGIGFGKLLAHNLRLLGRMDLLVATGYPLLIGASRKTCIGQLLGDVPVTERVHGSVAVALAAARSGADIVRVHDVRATRDALLVQRAIESAAQM